MDVIIYCQTGRRWWRARGGGYTLDKQHAHRYKLLTAVEILNTVNGRTKEPNDVIFLPDEDTSDLPPPKL